MSMILNGIGHEGAPNRLTLLWTNPAPASAFAANKTAEVDRAEYDFLLIEFLTSSSLQYVNMSVLLNDTSIANQYISSCQGGMSVSRKVTINAETVAFSTGYYTKGIPEGNSNSTGTTYAIPYRIYGYIV